MIFPLWPSWEWGGLGKTALAKAVYNDGKIQQHFQEQLWVCVSTSFEVNFILKRILESLKPEHAAVQARQAICENLKKELKGKRYLLVLDDVWNEDAHKWEELIGCLENANDTQGSSILVTTRRDTVANLVETFPRRDLEKLSDDECWLILKDRAIPVGSAPVVEDQEKIGREIAKKCGGVPLVAKVLGNMMRRKKLGWQSIGDNVIWNIPGEDDRILAVLKLSFDELGTPSSKQSGVLGRLTNLRSLPFVEIGKETGTQIGEFGGLNHLKDTLSTHNMEHVRDKEAEKANLVEKKHVRKLVPRWGLSPVRWGLSRPSNSADSSEVVLEVLRPHSNLEFLEIHDFLGVKFPSWLLLCSNLKERKLYSAPGCAAHPSISAVHLTLTFDFFKMDGGDGRVRGAPGCAEYALLERD
ncbi:hypothetical protein ACLB2K_065589 [Fragaria x ananassa]